MAKEYVRMHENDLNKVRGEIKKRKRGGGR